MEQQNHFLQTLPPKCAKSLVGQWVKLVSEGARVQTVGVEVVERTVDLVEDIPATWQCWHCYFLSDGHLASRVQVGSPVNMRLLLLQIHTELRDDTFEKRRLVWEEDMQIHSKFLDRMVTY